MANNNFNNILIPQDAANILKCSVCNMYLSVAPVLTSEYGDVNKHKCGRCHQFGSAINTRAVVYEKLAQFMIFPCINQKCKEKLIWGSVLAHEKICAFRTIFCPSDDCQQTIEIEQIINHFSNSHVDYKKKDYLEVSDVCLSVENFTVFLLVKSEVKPKKEKPFLFFQFSNDIYIWFSLFCFSAEDANETYEIRLMSQKNSFIVSDQKVVLFNNNEHCIKCVLRTCDLQTHKFSKPFTYSREICDSIMTTKLENFTVRKILQTAIIDYAINIVDDNQLLPKAKKSKIETRSSSRREEFQKQKEETRLQIDKILLENIECPVCSSYMFSPIFQCRTGHSMCHSCLKKLTKCPFCQDDFFNLPHTRTRNFALENISEIFNFRPKHC